jgi:hypothetical protein
MIPSRILEFFDILYIHTSTYYVDNQSKHCLVVYCKGVADEGMLNGVSTLGSRIGGAAK